MLKAKLIAGLAIVLLALAACGEDENGDNQTTNNDTTNQTTFNDTTNNDTTNNDTTNNDTTNNDTTGGELDAEAFFATSLAYDKKAFGYVCECLWEETEFESREECEEAVFVTDEDVAMLGACVQSVVDDADPAPQSVIDYFGCMEENIEASEACFDGLDDTDWCTEEMAGEVEACDAIAYEGLGEDCDALVDEEGGAWLEEFDVEVEAKCEI